MTQVTATHLRVIDGAGPEPIASPTPEAVYREYARYVAGIAFRLLGRDDDVDDVVQDVFAELVRQFATLDHDTPLQGWLATVAVRAASKRLRRRRMLRAMGFGAEPEYEQVAAPTATPEQRVTLSRLYKVLDTVSVDDRMAWTVRHIEGERLEVVADRCACSLATAKRRIASAHHVLKRELGYG